MRIAPVWIRLSSLPQQYWDSEILEELGSCLGSFIKISEQTKSQRYTTYAHICIYMDLSKALLEEIRFLWEVEEWLQNLDYEQVPFRCRRCHEYGHLFRECPLNHPKKLVDKVFDPADPGFSKVSSRK